VFTGIVQELGTVRGARITAHGGELTIVAPRTIRKLTLGSSVAIDGVCTTIGKIQIQKSKIQNSQRNSRTVFRVRLMPVTLKLTTLGSLKAGDRVNLEPSLRVGDELGGHFVMGHVDATAAITGVTKITNYQLQITVPRSLTRFIVARGAIAVDGVSLTVVKRVGTVFTVSLVDYTLKHTILGSKKVGDHVNIEVDPLARYALNKSALS